MKLNESIIISFFYRRSNFERSSRKLRKSLAESSKQISEKPIKNKLIFSNKKKFNGAYQKYQNAFSIQSKQMHQIKSSSTLSNNKNRIIQKNEKKSKTSFQHRVCSEQKLRLLYETLKVPILLSV